MWDWLSWTGWNGVSGIFTALGSIAVAIAVADFLIRRNSKAPDAVHFKVSREDIDGADATKFRISMRVMGSAVLYEPIWQLYKDGRSLPELPPRLDTVDGPQTIELSFLNSIPPEGIWLGVVWVTPLRRALRAGARVSLGGAGLQQWRIYRWRLWPRKVSGRWVTARPRYSPRFRLSPPPID